MIDISLCADHDCPSRESCIRYTAQPADYQSYADFGLGRDGRERCDSYLAPPRPMPTVQP